MSAGTIIALLVLGLIAGILSSMVGIGGGIVVVPALVFLFGLSQKTAQGTSLAMLLPPIGIMGVLVYHKSGNIRWDFALLLVAAFIVGSYFGANWVKNLNTIVIKRIFAIFMIVVAIKYLFFDKPKNPENPKQVVTSVTDLPAGTKTQ
ncbi:sulfite exporter TauE/SafE family protein [Chitinophagaceae bacterium MMS25-I14]